MAEKPKAKTYGRKPRNRDLVEAFGSLTVSNDNRSPLAEGSGNALKNVPPSPRLRESKSRPIETLKIISPQCTPLLESDPPPASRITQESTAKHSHRKLRSVAKSTLKSKDKDETLEDRYLAPLTAILDVEKVVQHFHHWAETMDKLLDIEMIGDGSYANVFKLSFKKNPQDYSIAKLIPLRPKRGPGSRSPGLTTVENAASELRVMSELSGVTGFTDFKRAMLLRGQLPWSFRKACREFGQRRKIKRTSTDSGQPSPRVAYPKQQLWLFVEMGDAGIELEQILLGGLKNGPPMNETSSHAASLTVPQTRDIFYSIVEALALGEREAKFEHRDLHLSNVCLKALTRDGNASDLKTDWRLVPTTPTFAVTLIDYTLSRVDTADGTVFNPMNDEEIFGGQGDYQYDIYRYMRQAVHEDAAHDWSAFVPQTNVLWLHYVLERLLEKVALNRASQASASYPSRITVSLSINIVAFTLLALSTLLFTQVPSGVYFGFLMVIVCLASLACGFAQNGVFAYASGFGFGEYTQAAMTGQAVAGVLPCIAQIFLVYSISEETSTGKGAGQESPRSAFAFFLTASVVSAITLAAFLLVLFRRHGERAGEAKGMLDAIDGAEENVRAARKTVSMWVLFNKLRWLAIAVFIDFSVTMLFPVFTQKIQSVRESAAAPRLFQPVCFVPFAFLFWNAGDLLGRLITLIPKIATSVEYPRAIFTITILRAVFIPLYLLCNINGRGAAIHSDAFYLLIVQFPFGLTNGFVGSICMMGASHWVAVDEREAAGGFMGFMLVAGLTVGSLLSFLI
ncbi:MAG: hypothetical protein Q9195_003676 [Heterodermia aff. obscurata]